ncbi:MAG: hypothetical protein ACLP0J_30900 [Solirubrobacteraceae bacterium]
MMRLRLLAPLIVAVLASTPSLARADGGPIMPLSQVTPGMACTAYTVIQGTTISSFDVQIIGVVQEAGQGARILVSVSGPAVAQSGIAEGFSGSPVYCPDALGTPENIGAISEGVGQYGNNVGLVTPIEQMLGEPIDPPSSAPLLRARARPLLGPLTVSGLSPALLNVLQQAGARAGRQIVDAPGGPVLNFSVQPLIPGASVAVSYSEGAIALGAVGTVTYRDAQTVYAFGHELDGAGARSLLLQDAYVYGVIDNPDPALDPSYKLASEGHTEGTLTSDTPNAVIGTVGAPPALIPVNVTATDLDTGQVLNLDSEVADETDLGFPLGTSLIDMVAPLQVAQAATQIYNGPPAEESGSMCVEVTLRETRAPLQFCNRYVGTGSPGTLLAAPELASATSTDVTTALTLLDSVQFAQLHVTGVSAQIDAQRGLAQGWIVSAHAPLEVSAGQTVEVRLLVRLYRGPLRTLSFPVRIPQGMQGPVMAEMKGPTPQTPSSSSGSVSSLGSMLEQLLSGAGSAPTGAGPASIAALGHQFGAVGRYDGLRLSFNGKPAIDALRDRSLLIFGSTQLPFLVKAPAGGTP